MVWEKAGPQLMYGMVVAWGQWLVAILVTGALLIPMFNVHPLFASILPVGFAGGHGTAAGLTDTYKKLGMEDGGDYGLASATVGLVFSITLGKCPALPSFSVLLSLFVLFASCLFFVGISLLLYVHLFVLSLFPSGPLSFFSLCPCLSFRPSPV